MIPLSAILMRFILNPHRWKECNKFLMNSQQEPFYRSYIKSGYHALHVLFGQSMRIIIGAPKRTRMVNTRTELNLSSVYERGLYINATFSFKAI